MTEAHAREILRLIGVGFELVRSTVGLDASGSHGALCHVQDAALRQVLGDGEERPRGTLANLAVEERAVVLRVLGEETPAPD